MAANGIALRGKSLMWAVTTGGGESHFDIGSFPGFPGAGAASAGNRALLRDEMAAAVRYALHLYLR